MASTTLEIRPSDNWEWYEEMPDGYLGNVYAVALIEALPFPGDSHPEGVPAAVVCANHYKTRKGKRKGELLWGWVHLGPDAKEEIGRVMEDAGAETGRWYYVRLTTGEWQ